MFVLLVFAGITHLWSDAAGYETITVIQYQAVHGQIIVYDWRGYCAR